ncbi:MAG: hypothetical protein RIR96_826 [Bacteroidota bacterium]|jgi:predicted RND superfamily exporter protein
MWKKLAEFVLRFRFVLLLLLLATTGIMGYFASQVKLSYDFAKAIPTDNPKYKDYQAFKARFGDDGNVVVIGVQNKDFFSLPFFKNYVQWQKNIKESYCVEDVLAVPSAVMLIKDSTGEKLLSRKIFSDLIDEQAELDSAAATFKNLPFYQTLLYNPESSVYLMAVRVNKDSMNSPARSRIIHDIQKRIDGFERQNPKIETHISGLPLIRTLVAEMIQKEMKLFLWGSLLFSILILLLFFRSISTTILSMGVVVVGVVWTVAMIHLLGYKITLLTALLPSLVVVIGLPNCIYFINKYHTSYLKYIEMDGPERKRRALVEMVSKMGVVTLFCNITAAIGFAVFALTKSAILKEFGIVAGLSILLIFVVSFIMLPAVLSYLPDPQKNQLKYLDARWIGRFLNNVEKWVFLHKKAVWITTGLILTASVAGILQLRSVTFIVDDLPKSEKIYQDLKFFEKHFKGIMPLEIVIDSKKKRGLRGLKPFQKADSLSTYIASLPDMNRPLALSEGLKFATQGLNENDPSGYRMPGDFEAVFLMDLMKGKGNSGDNLTRLLKSFMDQDKRYTRISVSMADVGTEKLPALLDSIQNKANQYFDTSYQVTLTGTSITFLEGSKFIVNGLKESIFWAFLLIALCMLYLFRSFRILLCSLIPNLVPLIITAGIMGWTGVPLKPSTVLVFSVALGIAVDITIRFLVNYRQVLPEYNNNVESAVKDTVQQTGLSIIYTSLVLMAGFIIFCASSFGGTFALGWLTSITLLAGTITNLVLLPILLMLLRKKM